MNKNIILKLITLILVLINIFLIFSFSSEQASVSKETSKKVTEKVLEVTVPDFREKPEPVQKNMIKKTDAGIRTLAHFSEYTLLGFLVFLHLSLYKMSKIKKASLAFSGCSLCAIADEIYQISVPGRSFQFTDILVDVSGGLLGIAILSLIFIIVKKCVKKTAVS